LCYGPLCFPYQYKPEKDVFNAAQSGAMIPDLKKHEFKYLYEQLTKNPKVNLKEDWKLLTILIGYNDLCLGCSDDVPYLTADDFESNLRDILEEVHSKIPRVFVNLVQLFNLSMVYEKSKNIPHCKDIHRILPIECLCIFADGEIGDKLRRDVDELGSQYNKRLRKVAAEFRGRGYSDFSVVAQPGVVDGTPDTAPVYLMSDVSTLCALSGRHRNSSCTEHV
jgi:phospholipase B1